MTRLAKEHQLANKAVQSVCSLLAEVGCLSEKILNDYGEDLLVQTQISDVADSFHIMLQIKGTEKLKSGPRGKKYRFDVSHLRRWASLPNPFFVCIYDESSRDIYAIDPRSLLSLWELSTTNRKTVTAYISEEDALTINNINSHLWKARTEYYSRMLAWSEMKNVYSEDLLPRRHKSSNSRELLLITFSLLASMQVVNDDKIGDEFLNSIINGSINLSVEEGATVRSVFMLAMLGQADRIFGGGLPLNLLEHSTELSAHMMMQFHPDEWTNVKQRFPNDAWVPFRQSIAK